ncbi:V-type ATP synthase subunit E [Spirochaetia bacterium]|nr:V-type ATP synthase subunit E [Spirochaetia bacterium]
MDIDFEKLIEKIKKDGIESASEEAGRLKSQAEAEAKRIVEAAGKEADAIIAKAKTDAERSEKAGIAAVGQASRNLVLAFKAEIDTVLDKIVNREVAASYNSDTLKAVLPEVLKAWASKNSADSLSALLPEADLKKLEAYFNDKLAAELKSGLELKAGRNLGAGFRIASKDGAAYYDFSAEAVAEMFSAYLNPRLAETVKTAAKGL